MEAIERFRDRAARIDAVRKQRILGNSKAVATALVDAGELVSFPAGAEIIVQGANDSDAYFLLSGKIDLWINGMDISYGRGAGEVVGEFAAINSALPRTSTVIAATEVVALKCSSSALRDAAKGEPEIWELLAIELTTKIEQRNRFINAANDKPSIFMIAAEDRIPVAEEIRLALSVDFPDTQLWSDEDLAPPGSYELDRLRQKAAMADFAIVLAHPADLWRSSAQDGGPGVSILFELGFLMSALGRHRTVLLICEGERADLPEEFKGLKPLTYPATRADVTGKSLYGPVVRQLRNYIIEKKVRSRLQRED
ncbi:TIR domain-containing protein [Sphingomonas sp. KR3-1]|uniref:cyclic nucleotide-binding domain-containing protein n=1 Tax=Sphingomonas sp. KR3-1 TaxID=3156611 RepID=UPI0032B326A8